MLASTVQFSTYDQTPTRLHRQTRTSPQGQRRYDRRSALTREETVTTPPGGGPALSGPNSVPTTTTPRRLRSTPTEVSSTGSRPQPAAELVSVPPSSTTPHAPPTTPE